MQQKSFGKLPEAARLERIRKSPNYRDGTFVNLEETKLISDDASYFSMITKFFGKGVNREPVQKLPFVKTDLKNFPSGETTIIWFGHSSYLIHSNNKNILVDPVFSERPSPVQYAGAKRYAGTEDYGVNDLPQIDFVIISHDHYDHLDYNTITYLKSNVHHFFVPMGVGAHLDLWGVPADRITEFDWWEGQSIADGFYLTATPARHFSGRGFKRNRTLWSSYVLQTPDHKIFIGGDSGYDKSFKNIGDKFGPFDIAILECGQYDVQWPEIHMMPEETVQASIDLHAKVFLPVHWAKFTLALHPWKEPIQRAVKHAASLQVKVTAPKIGEPIIVNKVYPFTEWWNTVQ